MNRASEEIREEVQLPDPAVQPLVHPLDLPEARKWFRNARLVAAFTSIPVAALVAAVVAYASRSVLPPIIVFLALSVFGAMAGRWFTDRAWDYIPRKRQDRERPPPRSWEIGSAIVPAVVLGVALLLFVFRFDDPDVPVDVRSYTFGMCLVAALLVVADSVAGLVRRRARRRALGGLPGTVVVVAVTVLAWTQWFAGDADAGLLIWGALTMAGVAVLVAAAKLWDRRRAA
jgi:hypothetical protein